MNSRLKRVSRMRRTRFSTSGGFSRITSSVVSIRLSAPSSARYASPSGVASISPARVLRANVPGTMGKRPSSARDSRAEVFGGHVLDLMRLVEDDGRVVRDDLAELAAAQREVGEEEVVVDDDDVGVGRALAHARDVAGVVVGARS